MVELREERYIALGKSKYEEYDSAFNFDELFLVETDKFVLPSLIITTLCDYFDKRFS